MSIFAGVLLRSSEGEIPPHVVADLRAAISRSADDVPSRREFADGRLFAISIDTEGSDEPATYADAGRLAWIAGNPILQPHIGAPALGRSDGLNLIAEDLRQGRMEAMRRCRGTYCATVYERGARRLHLVVDKLGVRPLYCWVSPELVVFSTALRIVEAMASCAKTLDLAGVAEIGCFGYPLADRTPYREVFCLFAGEAVCIGADGMSRQRYWKWDDLPAAPSDGAPLPQALHQHFMDAVRLRLGSQKVVAAFLSGGLDSRAVVAALKAAGAEVHTANFGDAGSQDQVFGRMAAENLGVPCRQLARRPRLESDPYSKGSVAKWLESAEYLDHGPQRARAIWSGDGGSVGLGHVYLREDIVAAARSGDLRLAADLLQSHTRWRIQTRLLKRDVGRDLARLVARGIQEELRSIHPPDPGRTVYLFLMLNDQRRHMFNHFENLDLAPLEFEMPFFDSEFIAAIVRAPIDRFLRHVLYLDWLKCFPAEVLAAPWQAYPGHVPCPLPLPSGLTYQWQRNASPQIDDPTRRVLVTRARNLLRQPGFALRFLDRLRMEAFILLTRWTSADRTYLLHAPSLIERYWRHTREAATSE